MPASCMGLVLSLSPYPAPWGSQCAAVLSQLGVLSATLVHPTAMAVSALL